jgi:isoleucyl-tRNA synthetase
MRFMLSNLDDLGEADVVARERMEPLDRLACSVTDAFVAGVKEAYDACQIHDAYLRIIEFESGISGLYFDALKDPLYSRAAADPRRRSAQSALLYIMKRFSITLAPVLSFTTEEAWQHLPTWVLEQMPSVFDGSFESDRFKAVPADNALWQLLRSLRTRVAASSEPRDFEAQLRLTVEPGDYKRLHALGDNLREVLVVSQLELHPGAAMQFELLPADGEKCVRCWKFRQLGADPDHPQICEDCARVVRGPDNVA